MGRRLQRRDRGELGDLRAYPNIAYDRPLTDDEWALLNAPTRGVGIAAMEQSHSDGGDLGSKKEAGETDRKGEARSALLAVEGERRHAAKRCDQCNDRHWQREQARWTKRGVIIGGLLTGLLILAACVSAYFVYGQWTTMDDTLRATREGSEASARAWIIHTNNITMTCPIAGQPMTVRYDLLNAGNRPAVFRTHAQIGQPVVGEPGKTKFPFGMSPPYEPIGDRVESKGVAGPNQWISDSMEVKALPGDWARVLTTRAYTLFVYGQVEYEDGYGVTRRTVWCYYWRPEDGCRKYSFQLCDTYNNAT